MTRFRLYFYVFIALVTGGLSFLVKHYRHKYKDARENAEREKLARESYLSEVEVAQQTQREGREARSEQDLDDMLDYLSSGVSDHARYSADTSATASSSKASSD